MSQTETVSSEHYARFSDGKSASARDAEVRLGLSGIEIRILVSGEQILWPYETLSAREPLRTHAIDVLLNSSLTPGASLFVPSPDVARALRHSAPQLTARAERLRHAKPWLYGALAVAALTAVVYASGWSPVRTIATSLPHAWRERLGDQAIASMAEDRKLCVSPAGAAAMDMLSQRLTKSANISEPFQIEVYDWSLVNAFAVPGGKIVMTRALIEEAESPDEVAGVLAHEMGHGIELHPETGIIRAIGLSAAVELMLGGSGGTLANFGLILAQLGYTRAAEHEADLQALNLLKGAAISPTGLGDFFRRVEKGGVSNDKKDNKDNKDKPEKSESKRFQPFDLFRTHPPTEERERLVRSRANYPATPALDARSWNDLKAICKETRDRKPPEKPTEAAL